MKIIIKNNNRFLIKDNNEKVNISDNSTIEYTGIYYKTKNISMNEIIEKIETKFIGNIDCDRSSGDEITGIYVKPIYILHDNEWKKINNYIPPSEKYFLYPHLLILPEHTYNYYPLYFLHTCNNKFLYNFNHIIKDFSL